MLHTYRLMKNIYHALQLLENTDDDELWFTTLLKVEKYCPDYVEQKTEYRIGKDLSNQKLWKLLFDFLKRRNEDQKLLQLYSKLFTFNPPDPTKITHKSLFFNCDVRIFNENLQKFKILSI